MEFLIGAGVLIVLVLAVVGIALRMADKRGGDRVRVDRLSTDAERVARQDRIRARPLPRNVRNAWERFVRRTTPTEPDD